MNYQVIVVLDEARQKSYYYSYYVSDDTELGNITCAELPPYQDINKAQACYWDVDNAIWVYDAEKYEEIMLEIAAEQAAAEREAAVLAATPTNEELMVATMEIAQGQSDIEDAITELAAIVAAGEGGAA